MSSRDTKPDPKLQQTMDQLLMDHGEYAPVELLLAEGRLLYSDYESWLNGDIEYLEDMLFGDPGHIKSLLQQADSYAAQLPMLSPQPMELARQNSRQAKAFSRNPTLEKIFATRYQKADNQPQMDLFFDGGAGNLVNGIILELASNDFVEARRLLEQLYDTQPDNTKLNDLETLVQYGERSHDSTDSAADLDYLQKHVTPVAQTHMAQRAREYLVPQWRRLTNSLTNKKFDNSSPELHASYTAMHAMDWHTARQAIEQEARWRDNPILLLRHVQACTRLWQLNEAILSWFYLCWTFPQDTDVVTAQVDHGLRHQWLEFLDLEPELEPRVFPAWQLLNKPGLVKTLPDLTHDENAPCDETYRIVHRMLASQQSGDSVLPQLDITLRQELRAADPVFFQHFIKRAGV